MLNFSPAPNSPSIQQASSLNLAESRCHEGVVAESAQPGVDSFSIALNDAEPQSPPQQPNALANPLPSSEDDRAPLSSDLVVVHSSSTAMTTVSSNITPPLEQPRPIEPSQSGIVASGVQHEPSPQHSAVPVGRVGLLHSPDHGHTNDNRSESSSSPKERPPPRVRWDTSLPSHPSSNPTLPRWDTPLPHPPLPHFQPNPPPTVNPMYTQNMTPLWGLNPPTLESFPSIPLYHSQTPPWYHTPHPLPLNPLTPMSTGPFMTSNPPFSGYGMNYTPSNLRMHPTPSGVGISANVPPTSTHRSFNGPYAPEASSGMNHTPSRMNPPTPGLDMSANATPIYTPQPYNGAYGYTPEAHYGLDHTPPRMLATPTGFDMSANSTPASIPTYNGAYGFTPGAPFMRDRPLENEEMYVHRQQPDNSGSQGHSSNPTSAIPPLYPRSVHDRPHERFYLIGGNVDFRVHNILFRVHFHFFSRARAFRVFGPYFPPVIDLNNFGFSPSDFGLLLGIFYPRTFGNLEIQTIEEWVSVLKVASALGMEDIHTLAVNHLLNTASPADRIMLASNYGVGTQRVVSAFKELCMSTRPLTEEEGRKVGVQGLIKLARMKNELQQNTAEYLDPVRVDQMLHRLVESA